MYWNLAEQSYGCFPLISSQKITEIITTAPYSVGTGRDPPSFSELQSKIQTAFVEASPTLNKGH